MQALDSHQHLGHGEGAAQLLRAATQEESVLGAMAQGGSFFLCQGGSDVDHQMGWIGSIGQALTGKIRVIGGDGVEQGGLGAE